jgi:hypothetical protein
MAMVVAAAVMATAQQRSTRLGD